MKPWTHVLSLALILGSVYIPSYVSAKQPLELIYETRTFVNSAFALAVSPDGTLTAIAGRKGTTSVHNSSSGSKIAAIAHDNGMVLKLAFSGDGKHLLTSGDPKRLAVVRVADWRIERTIQLPFRCGFLACHPTRPIAALGGVGPKILIYDFQRGELMGSLDSDIKRAYDLCFSPDGNSLYAVVDRLSADSRQNVVGKIDLTSLLSSGFTAPALELIPIANAQSSFHSLSLSKTGNRLAVVDRSGRVLIVDPSRQDAIETIQTPVGRGTGLAFLPDQEHFLVVVEGGYAIFRTGTPHPLYHVASEDAESTNHAFLSQGSDVVLLSHARGNNQLTARWIPKDVRESQGSPPTSNPNNRSGPAIAANTKSSKQSTMKSAPKPGQPSPPTELPPDQTGNTRQEFGYLQFARTWTAATTGKTIHAKCVNWNSTHAQLQRSDGTKIAVKRDQLSAPDQRFLDDLAWHTDTSFPRVQLSVLSQYRTDRGTFVNRQRLTPAQENEILSRINDIAFAPPWSAHGEVVFATSKGLEGWNGSGLKLIAASPDDLPRMSDNSRPPLEQSIVLSDDTALGIFATDNRVFRWHDGEWKATPGSETLEFVELVQFEAKAYAIARTIRSAKEKWFGIVRWNSERGWTKVMTYAPEKLSASARRIIPLNSTHYLVAWSAYEPGNPSFGPQNSTALTLHPIESRGPALMNSLSSAFRFTANFCGPAVTSHGVLYASTPQMPKRLLRWHVGAPVTSAQIVSPATIGFPSSLTDLDVSDAGVIWAIGQGNVIRMEGQNIDKIDLDDNTTGKIDIQSANKVLVRGNHLITIRSAPAQQN